MAFNRKLIKCTNCWRFNKDNVEYGLNKLVKVVMLLFFCFNLFILKTKIVIQIILPFSFVCKMNYLGG